MDDNDGLPTDKDACVLSAVVEKGNYNLLKALLVEHEESKDRMYDRWAEEMDSGKDYDEYDDFVNNYHATEATSRLRWPLDWEIDVAMTTAVRKNDFEAVDILMRYAKRCDDGSIYPVHLMAVKEGKIELLRRMMEERGLTFDEAAEAPLTVVAEGGDAAMLQFLLKKGLNANCTQGSKRLTPLHMSAMHGQVKCAMLLLEAGANINLTDRDGKTALHLAAKKGDDEMVKLLLDNHAKKKPVTKNGLLPWMMAASTGYSVLAKKLLDSGDVNQKNLLHTASKTQNVSFVKVLLALGADVNRLNDRGETPILIAAKYGFNRTLLKTLVKAGANCTLKDVDGYTPLTWSLLHHPTSSATFAKRAHILDMMLSAGADINSAMPLCPRGTKLIHSHVWDLDKAKWLLKHKADTSSISENSGTVWHSLLSVGIHRPTLRASLVNLLDYNVDLSLTAVSHKKLGTPLTFLFGKYQLTHSYVAICMLLDVECSIAGMTSYLTLERSSKIKQKGQKWKHVLEVVTQKCSRPKSLVASSRMVVLKHLGTGPIHGKVDTLCLPVNLKDYLHWREYISQLPAEYRLTSSDCID